MSRIGLKPIAIPSGVDVTIDGSKVTVKGPKGQLSREFSSEMKIEKTGEQILVSRPSDEREHKSLHGLTRTLIANMIEGVTKGFQKTLEIQGVGYRAQMQGNKLVLQMGYSHPVEFDKIEGINFEVEGTNKIRVKGIDKELVGQIAAEVREVRPVEPYKGKGIRYEGERVIRKAGKAAKK
jgi:large subunit ribosomal protein L6